MQLGPEPSSSAMSSPSGLGSATSHRMRPHRDGYWHAQGRRPTNGDRGARPDQAERRVVTARQWRKLVAAVAGAALTAAALTASDRRERWASGAASAAVGRGRRWSVTARSDTSAPIERAAAANAKLRTRARGPGQANIEPPAPQHQQRVTAAKIWARLVGEPDGEHDAFVFPKGGPTVLETTTSPRRSRAHRAQREPRAGAQARVSPDPTPDLCSADDAEERDVLDAPAPDRRRSRDVDRAGGDTGEGDHRHDPAAFTSDSAALASLTRTRPGVRRVRCDPIEVVQTTLAPFCRTLQRV